MTNVAWDFFIGFHLKNHIKKSLKRQYLSYYCYLLFSYFLFYSLIFASLLASPLSFPSLSFSSLSFFLYFKLTIFPKDFCSRRHLKFEKHNNICLKLWSSIIIIIINELSGLAVKLSLSVQSVSKLKCSDFMRFQISPLISPY